MKTQFLNPHNYFSGRMYVEALRQLMLPGLISGGILFVAVILASVAELVLNWGPADPQYALVWMPFYVWVAPFLLALLAFRFLTDRKKSDFYHALAIKRQALFSSYGLAVISWLLGSMIVTFAVSSLLFLFAGANLSWETMGLFAELLSAGVFAATLAMLAASLSGTIFSNLVLINLFLWLPLLVSSIFRAGVINAVPTMPSNAVSLFGLDLNITLFAVFDILWADPARAVDIVWTVTVGLLLFAAAAYFFVKRKSEMAGDSAPSPRMQAVYRIAVALPPLLIVFSSGLVIFRDTDGQFAAFVGLIVALIFMILFEMISTKRWQNLLKLPLSYALALALTALFAASVWAVSSFEANFVPEAEEIVSVRVIDDPDRLLIDDGETPIHAEISVGEVFEDSAVNAAIAEQLQQSREEGWANSSDPFGNLYLDESRRWDNEARLVFEIRTASGATRQRYLSVGTFIWEDWESRSDTFEPNDLGQALWGASAP